MNPQIFTIAPIASGLKTKAGYQEYPAGLAQKSLRVTLGRKGVGGTPTPLSLTRGATLSLRLLVSRDYRAYYLIFSDGTPSQASGPWYTSNLH